MAGSEKTGIQESRADLFAHATCILTRIKTTKALATDLIQNMWKVCGGKIILISPEDHDKIVTVTSHVPHLISDMLMSMFMDQQQRDPRTRLLVANGFRDTTRIAAWDPVMWTDIVLTNSVNISTWLDDFESYIRYWKKLLSLGHSVLIQKELAKIKKAREEL
jgi:prephenate dehydrogenase